MKIFLGRKPSEHTLHVEHVLNLTLSEIQALFPSEKTPHGRAQVLFLPSPSQKSVLMTSDELCPSVWVVTQFKNTTEYELSKHKELEHPMTHSLQHRFSSPITEQQNRNSCCLGGVATMGGKK